MQEEKSIQKIFSLLAQLLDLQAETLVLVYEQTKSFENMKSCLSKQDE